MTQPLPATALALLALGSVALAQDAPARPTPARPNVVQDTLDNGLEVIVEENHANPVVRVHAYMRIGSLYEDEYLGSGLSHYMEHIVSGGSTRRVVRKDDGAEEWVGRTEAENKALLKSIGNNSNASTFFNFTQYYITTESSNVETAIDLISDYLQNCQFDPVEVAREQRVVQQELLRNLDNPGRILSQTFSETMFKVHPARVPIIGYQDCIQRITRDDMFRFYAKHYTPQNCVVSVVGAVDKGEAAALVRRYFGGWKRKPLAPYRIPQEPQQTAMRWVEEEHGSTKTCSVSMGVPSIDLRHPDLYKLDMLSNVLGISASARLPRKFEHDPTRTAQATGLSTGSWTPAFGAGRFVARFSTDTVEHARALVWEIWDEMLRLKTELVTQDEIDRALKVLTKNFHLGRATVDDRAEELASNLAWLHDPFFNDTYLEKIRGVTPEEIREAARTYLVPERLNVVILTPPGAAQAAGEQASAEQTGQVEKVVLENGLTLLLKRLPGFGLVDVCATFNGGVIYEDEQTNGLFLLMGNTFWRGTESRPFPKLMAELDALGAELSADSHNNVYMVQARSLATDLPATFDLFADVLRNATVDPVWVDQLKTILLQRVLPNLEVQADSICDEVLRGSLYSAHPYRRQRFGTAESVAPFTADQVRELYRTFTRPNNCVLAIYGDIDVEATKALVREALGSWERGEIPPSKVTEDAGPAAPKTVELTNEQVRTNYRLAWRAVPRQDDEDRWALSVLNSIIGSSGWLHHRLREGSADYVYAVHGSAYPGDGAGHYAIVTDFSPADEQTVLKIIDGVVEDAKAGRFTDAELELAKTMILCYDALGKADNKSVCSGNALSELYGQGWDADVRYYAGLRKVTREDVVRVANEVFSRPALRILVRPAAGKQGG